MPAAPRKNAPEATEEPGPPSGQAPASQTPQEPGTVNAGFTAGAAPELPEQPWYIAQVPLPVGAEMGATAALPARAFNPGDRVPAEHVQRFGWHAYVAAPEDPAPEE